MEWFDIIKWWLVLEIIGIAAIPLSVAVFRNLNDKGVFFSKILGLMLVTYFSWVLTHLGLDYSTLTISISLLIMIAASIFT